MNKTKKSRIHYMDNMRAFMMMLGLVLHSGVSYVSSPANTSWPFRDPNGSKLMSMLILWIHSFRMEVFFIASGFFFYMLLKKRGSAQTFKHRIQRILNPMVLAWIFVGPLTMAGFAYASYGLNWSSVLAYASNPWVLTNPIIQNLPSQFLPTFANFSFLHLWFLYMLLIFCGIGLILYKVPITIQGKKIVSSPILPFAISALISISLIMSKNIYVDTSTNLIPKLDVLFVYGLFFFLGTLIYKNQLVLKAWAKYSFLFGAVGTIAYGTYYLFVQYLKTGQMHFGLNPKDLFLATTVFAGVSVSFTSLFFVGFFARYFTQQSHLWKYILETSYGVYLVHVPIAIWTSAFLRDYSLLVVMKFSITFAITTLVSFFIYNYAIRPTWVGQLLNGYRKPCARWFLFLNYKPNQREIKVNGNF